MGIFASHIFLSFLLISLFSHSSFCCHVYLEQSSLPVNDTEILSCTNPSTPCTSYCQIINYINSLSNNTDLNCTIHLMSDYTFNEDCQLTAKIDSLTFVGENLLFGRNNFTISFQKQLHFNSLQYVSFYYLNIKKANILAKNVYIYNCVIYGFKSRFDLKLDSFIALNSTINIIDLFKFNFVKFGNCILNGLNVAEFETLVINDCKFLFDAYIMRGAFVDFKNVEFLSKSSIAFVYTTSVSLDNTIFHKSDITTGALAVRNSNVLSIKNTKAYCKEKWALFIAVNFITLDNLYSTSAIDVSLPIEIQVRNSQFIQSTIQGLRISDASSVIITNSIFKECYRPIVIENVLNPHFQVDISNNSFTENDAFDGGAIYIASNFGNVKLSNNYFSENSASNTGGALYLNNYDVNSTVTIENCKFIKNYAGGLSINTKEGNGGAIYAVGKTLEITDNTVFLENSAIRGGAIFTNSFIPQTNALFKSNAARLAGGGIFLFKTDIANNNNFNFQNNTAVIYGKDKASFIKKVIIEYLDGNEVIPELTIFSGLPFSVVFKAYDIFNNPVNRILETPSYKPNFDDNNIKLNSLSSDVGGIYRFYITKSANYVLPPGGEKKNLTVHYPEASAIIEFTVVDCPSNYFEKIVDNTLLCEQKEFPLSAIITLSVLGAILFFIVGLAVGILILYGITKVTKKLKRLEKKEKAELEMEMKIIDKRVIFGDSIDYTPLLEDDRISSIKAGKKKKLSERKESFLIPIEELEVEKKIGEGGCGTVYSAKWGDNTVAIKSINAIDQEEDFEREVSLLSSLRHPNIVSFYGVTITDSAKFMVIEYLSKGSLKRVLNNVKSGKESLTLLEKLNILIGISQGMNYLHTLKPNAIIHRDLKPENVLLDSNGVCKVCDFGLSKIIGTATQTMTTNVGTLFYLSPEMLKGDNPSTITSKLDVYSFAIIMWELFFEENAYNNSNSSKINHFNHSNEELWAMQNVFLITSLVAKGVRPVIPFTTDEEKEIWINEFIIPFENNIKREQIFIVIDKYIQLMKECWSDNPNERPSFAEIIPQLKALKQNL